MLQPLTLDPRLDMPTLSPVTPLGKPQSPSQSPPKLTLKSVSIRRKRVHKRVQVDEEQAEALESEDESDKMPRFKLPDDKNVSHIENGTQVVEDNFCEVCHQMKIKQEIKDTGGITVKQEQISIEHESGMSGNAFHDVPAPSQASPSRDGQSRTPPNNSNFFQKIFESLIRERKFYKQELERMKEEQAKQVQGPSMNHLTEKLEDCQQENKDLQSQLDKATSERNRSLAQLKDVLEERDMLRESKADLVRRVNKSREIQDDFNKTLKKACDRAASAEVKAVDSLKEENKTLVEEDKHSKDWEVRTNAWKARLTETLRVKEELVEKAMKSEADLAQVEGKYQELMKKQDVLEEELKDVKEKELKATKEVQQQHTSQLAQVEATRCRELEDCRQELQVMVKEIKNNYEEKQKENTRKLAAAQQEAIDAQKQHKEKLTMAQNEASDMQKKWEDSEKKANDLNQALQSLKKQLNQEQNQAQNQGHGHMLESLRVNVYNLLKTLLAQNVLDNYVNDPRSAQVDDIVQRVTDDNCQE
ncbi:uncharacterized protein [Amphiura filiformis]|uniref:uncharacterized protein n=1 Tax=Amphiura filiformis TaxID=82378 RepID=UPI003B213646